MTTEFCGCGHTRFAHELAVKYPSSFGGSKCEVACPCQEFHPATARQIGDITIGYLENAELGLLALHYRICGPEYPREAGCDHGDAQRHLDDLVHDIERSVSDAEVAAGLGPRRGPTWSANWPQLRARGAE